MAYTSWRRIDSYFSGEVQAREYATFSRTNNTLHVSGFRSQWRVTVSGNDNSISTQSYMSSGTNRKTTNFGSESWSAWQVFSGNTWSGNIGVSSSATSISTRTRWADYSGAWYNSTSSFSIPGVGSPSLGTPSVTKNSPTSVTFNGTVNSWGTNATAGSGVRFGYNSTTGGTQLYTSRTTDSTPSATVSVHSNASLFVDMDATNGAGKSDDGPNNNYVSDPEAPVVASKDVEAVTATLTTTLDTGDGHYPITTQYRVKKSGDSYGSWTTFTNNSAVINNLLPSTDYVVELRSQTTAGTTVGATETFTTLPAVKIINSDGTADNAIPYVVNSDGTVQMLTVEVI